MADYFLNKKSNTFNTAPDYGNLARAVIVLKGKSLRKDKVYALGEFPAGTILNRVYEYSKNKAAGITYDLGLEQASQFDDYTVTAAPTKFASGRSQGNTGAPYELLWEGMEYIGRAPDQGGEADYPVPMNLVFKPTAVGNADDCVVLIVEYIVHGDY